MELYLKIKAIRKQLELTQEEFADKLGITRSNYSHFERGKSNLTFETIQSIVNEFNINSDYFFNNAIDDSNINDYLNGYLNGYLNDDLSNKKNIQSKKTETNNAECKSCQEKERIIEAHKEQTEALKGQIESLKQQVADLRKDKEDCKEMLAVATHRNAETHSSSKQRSA